MVEHPIANLKELLVISMVDTQKIHQAIMIIAMDTKKWSVNRGANIENKTSPQTYIRRKMNWHSKGHNVFLKV